MEKILCAAIWYKEQPTAKMLPMNVDKGVVISGHNHSQCLHTFVALTGKRSVVPECGDYEQGFLTDKNRFVDRAEGFKIAKEAKQLNNRQRGTSNRLYSEDLY